MAALHPGLSGGWLDDSDGGRLVFWTLLITLLYQRFS